MLIYLRALHIVMNLVWVGSTLSLAVLLTRGPGDTKQRGEAGRQLAKLLAAPSSGLSLILGLAMLGLEPVLYFKATHFMHAKLPLALAAFGITHALGARARRMAEGQAQDAGPAGILGAVFAVLCLASALLASLKPFLSTVSSRGDRAWSLITASASSLFRTTRSSCIGQLAAKRETGELNSSNRQEPPNIKKRRAGCVLGSPHQHVGCANKRNHQRSPEPLTRSLFAPKRSLRGYSAYAHSAHSGSPALRYPFTVLCEKKSHLRQNRMTSSGAYRDLAVHACEGMLSG